jgi:hypothetical protein
METKFFVVNLPPTMTESRLRKLMNDNALAVVSFVQSVHGTVALVEPATSIEGQQLERVLASAKSGGRSLEVIRADSPAGRQLGDMFRNLRRHQLHAIGQPRAPVRKQSCGSR